MRLAELLDDNDLHAQLRLVIGKYRTYERDTQSAGSSTPTTASGGSSAPTSSTAAAHRHQMTNGNQTALGIANRAVFAQNADGSAQVGFDLATNASALHTYSADGSHSHSVDVPGHQHSVTIDPHSHLQQYDIFEDASYPGPVSIELDQVNIDSLISAPFQASDNNNTFDVSLTGILVTPGWHRLRISTASGRGRSTPYLIVKSLQLQ